MRTRTFATWLAVLALAAPLNAHADELEPLPPCLPDIGPTHDPCFYPDEPGWPGNDLPAGHPTEPTPEPTPAAADDHDALSERHMAESLAELQSAELLAEMHPAAEPTPTHDESSVTHIPTQPVAQKRPALPSTGANR